VDVQLVVAIAIGLIVVWAIFLVIFWLLRPKGVPIREIIRVVPDVIRLLRSLVADGSVPPDVRVVIGGLFLWIISPIDLIPEFLPGIGPLDDVIVAVVALRYVRRRLGIEDLRHRWTGSSDGFSVLESVIGSGSGEA
jgi:uncharacterized membrane protein YkvA (DUF1232 family)